MKLSKKKIYVLAAIAIGVLGSVVIFADGSDSSRVSSMPVDVEVVKRDTIESTITAQGEVFLLDSEVLFINNSLEVREILVRENDVVTQGQPLIIFNTNTREREREREKLEIQLRDAQLNLRSAEVTLEHTLIPPTQSELESARLNVSRAEQSIVDAELALVQLDAKIAQQYRSIEQQQRLVEQQHRTLEQQQRVLDQRQNALDDANTNFANMQVLLGVGGATQNQLDNAERDIQKAELDFTNIQNDIINTQSTIENSLNDIVNREEALITLDGERLQAEQSIISSHDNLEFARIQLNEIENKLTNPQTTNSIAQQQIAIDRIRLTIEKIQNDINNLNDVEETLLSPISGTITNISVTNGEIVTPTRPLIEISDAKDYVLRAFVNERHAGQIGVGQEVLIEGSILGNDTVYGQIRTVGTVAQSAQISGTPERVVPVEISVAEEESNILIPGVTVDVTITTDVREDVIAIPALSTISQRDGSTFVFVINEDNTLEQREITVVTYADMLMEVHGLEEGEMIILQPTHNMETGMLVTPTNID